MAALTIRDNWFPAINALPDAERGKLFSALIDYRAGKEPEGLEGISANLFAYMRGDVDLTIQRASAGAKGSRSRSKNQANLKQSLSKSEANFKQSASKNEEVEQEPSPPSSPLSPLHPSLPPIIPPQETLLSPPPGGDGETAPGSFKRTPPPLPHDSDAYKAARYLDRRIRDRLPTKPPSTEATLQAWARDIDKLHRIDGQSWDDIADALEFSQNDSFWAPNIMSGAKFRKQFFQLMSKMQKEARK